MSLASSQRVGVEAATCPTTSLPAFITAMTRFTYVREKDDQRAGFRSDEPVSHQWATAGHESSQTYRAVTFRWATISWFVGVCGAVELPR